MKYPKEYFFKKLRLIFYFKTNFSIIQTLNISNFLLGPLEVRDIESQLY